MPPSSAPDSPASRSTARSTDTVVWVRASSTIGWPARRASSRASRTTAGSRVSRGVTPLAMSLTGTAPSALVLLALVLLDAPGEQGAHARLVPDQAEGKVGVAGHVAVPDQHGDVGRDALGAERGGRERGGHGEEDHGAARRGGQDG